ncbi:hypothetical protein TVAG_431000 [Trichomonas vaginalis G3]|uniref:Exocyst complex component Sec10-like alpha-helical bundle domain-containing protein n=1 Tax=Trichomonas vaginalis (strain ATCC PRA-98 / G3) TaxID=412133 RepID=A2EZD8_TRIV3|nr:exocyst complex component Sec10-like family [Trichomonas vaginalis G3]EAY01959.1 hypothetical protein TVAG_431000 [Trichomonas vaginalis G3]KAI5523035.1 exocyst complex component Sec10-like family [Trichomonas vaginalis G3]|eukprot:XP_001314469.1 hypothetical protein [Trichomonas vaginalis G3]
MSAVRERDSKKIPVTEFMISDIEKNLKADQMDLLKLRESNILDLKHYANEATSKREDFVANLAKITKNLQETKDRSNELYASTNQISVDFSKVTDQLDFAASLVQRAEDMSIIITYIQEFNKPLEDPPMVRAPNQPPPDPNNPDNPPQEVLVPAFDPLDILLKSIKFPPTLYQCAELCAKLFKIVTSAERDYLQNARINLIQYRERLKDQLLEQFVANSKINKYEQAKCASALGLLSHEYEAMEAFIKSTPIMTDAGKKYHFKEKYLFEDESILLDHYKGLCSFFVTDCKKSWDLIDVIFTGSQQPKTVLVTTVFNTVFDAFISRVLNHYLETPSKQNRFCDMFYKLHNETDEMLKSIWALDGQTFSNQNIMENTFHNFQTSYETLETQALTNIMLEQVVPHLKKLRQIIENAKKWLTRKEEVSYDIFSEFNPQMPITILTNGAAAWERCVVLCDPQRKHQVLKSLIDLVIQANLREYLITYLEACRICMMKENDINTVPRFLAITSVINMSILTIEAKYSQILKPHLMQKPQYHEMFLRDRESLISSLEDGITKNLQICINIITDRVKSIVATKNFKNSFLQQNVDGSVSQSCKEICQILTGPNSVIQEATALSGDNNISFCSVLAKELIDTICNALFEVRYDFPEGTMQLSMDLNEYRNAFIKFNLDFVNIKFEDLDIAAKIMCTPADRIQMVKKDLQMTPKSIDLAKKLLPLRTDAKDEDLANAL